MQLSAEIRWFWPENPPSGLKDWFVNASGDVFAAGGGKPGREDEYLRDPKQVELGIKRRGGGKGIEVKGLVVECLGDLAAGPFVGPIELWTKWVSEPLKIDGIPTIKIKKQRWLRKFDGGGSSPKEIRLDADEKLAEKEELPTRGCNVELTYVQIADQGGDWWTLGFEAFGTISTVEADLRAVAATLNQRQPPRLEGGLLASYPMWLKTKVLPV
ncbi:MAG TPA: hypothetical protein VIW92_11205 [Thermoanaerobaculia bacterium]